MTRKETIETINKYLNGELLLINFKDVNVENFRNVFSELSMVDHDNYFRLNTNLELIDYFQNYYIAEYHMLHYETRFQLNTKDYINNRETMTITNFINMYLEIDNIDSIQSLEF